MIDSYTMTLILGLTYNLYKFVDDGYLSSEPAFRLVMIFTAVYLILWKKIRQKEIHVKETLEEIIERLYQLMYKSLKSDDDSLEDSNLLVETTDMLRRAEN